MRVRRTDRRADGDRAFRLLPSESGTAPLHGSSLRSHALALVLLLAALEPLTAQFAHSSHETPPGGHRYVVSIWTTMDGLPQNSVNDILETRDGRLWVATFGGLARFDGTSFDVLGIADLPELGSNRILSLAEARTGGIWVSTTSDRVLRISGDEVVERLEAPSSRGPFHNGLRVGGAGELILGRQGAVHTYAGGEWERLVRDQASSGMISGIDTGPGGRIWLASRTGLESIGAKEFGATNRIVRSDRARAGATAVRVDKRGRVWFATSDGLAHHDPALGREVTVSVKELDQIVGRISAIETDDEDGLWIGGSRGIAHLHVDSARRSAKVLYSMRSPGERTITRILLDRRGVTWVGTRGGGLIRIAPGRVRHITSEDGLPIREVNHVAPAPEGGVRVAGACHGVSHVRIGSPPEIRELELSEYGQCSSGMTVDPDGNLWITFRSRGALVRVPATPGEEVRAWGPSDGIDAARRLNAPVSLPDGDVWFGYGFGGLGHVRDTTITLYDPGFGLPAERITSLAYDTTGSLWVGLSGKVAVVPVSGSEIGDVRLMGEEHGVPPGAIRAIVRDRDGDVWIGSYGGGLARRSEDGSRFERLTSEHGLPDNSISSLIEDARNRFWILGNRGVSVVDRAVLDSVLEGTRARIDAVVFDSDDGMPEGSGGSPAAWLGDDGVAWFSTIDGLVSIDTGSFPWDTVAPIPEIESIRFGENERGGVDGPIAVGGGAQAVSFRFSATSAAAVVHPLFRYRLVGQDDTWVYRERSAQIRYPRIPPGSYTFLVEARNEDGVWSARPASVEFRILPLWWQTGWFRWGAGLLAVGLVAVGLVRRIRIAEFRARRLELAIEERDRAEERARRQQREMEHVARIATAGELATSLAHELNQPLMAIVSNAAAGDRLLSNPDLGKEVVREALEEIMHEGRRASDVIKELREFLKRGSVETEPLRVNQLVRDVMLLLGSEVRETGADVDLQLAGELPDVLGNRVQLQQVLINLIMNALDAMRGQETGRRLKIRTRHHASGVEVEVQDTGPGFPPDEFAGVFEAFVTTKSTGMGVGLAISRSLVQAHGGRIVAGNSSTGGALVKFTLPCASPGPEGEASTAESSRIGRTAAGDRPG